MDLVEITTPQDESDPIWATLKGVAQTSNLRFQMSAALISRKNRIVAVANNMMKTHPRYGSKKGWNTLHCEGNLLWTCEKLGINPAGMTMIVFRKNFLNAKPCKDCEEMLKKAKIKKVIYTNYESGHFS